MRKYRKKKTLSLSTASIFVPLPPPPPPQSTIAPETVRNEAYFRSFVLDRRLMKVKPPAVFLFNAIKILFLLNLTNISLYQVYPPTPTPCEKLAPFQLPTPETQGETGSVHPKRSQKAALQHVKQKNLHFSVTFWDRFGWTDPVSP